MPVLAQGIYIRWTPAGLLCLLCSCTDKDPDPANPGLPGCRWAYTVNIEGATIMCIVCSYCIRIDESTWTHQHHITLHALVEKLERDNVARAKFDAELEAVIETTCPVNKTSHLEHV